MMNLTKTLINLAWSDVQRAGVFRKKIGLDIPFYKLVENMYKLKNYQSDYVDVHLGKMCFFCYLII